jgi:intein/homing endonuclease
MPMMLSRQFVDLEGMTTGRRIKKAQWPTFVTDSECPLDVLREFLGGLFGGDGHAPYLHRRTRTASDVRLEHIKFSFTAKPEWDESMMIKMQQLRQMLHRFDIDTSEVRKHGQTYPGQARLVFSDQDCDIESNQPGPHACTIEIMNNERFITKIGFRFCIQKTMKSSAALSYHRLVTQTKRQHDRVVKRALMLKELDAKKRGSLIRSLKLARAELLNDEPALNEYHSLSTVQDIKHRQDRKGEDPNVLELRSMNFKHFPRADIYLESIGALKWFNPREYIVPREQIHVPYFRQRVLAVREAGEDEVYDIEVAEHHSFLANGTLISNSQKGVIGLIKPKVDCPFTADGIFPDFFININSQSYRMMLVHL